MRGSIAQTIISYTMNGLEDSCRAIVCSRALDRNKAGLQCVGEMGG